MPGYHCPNCLPMPLAKAKSHAVGRIPNDVLNYLERHSGIKRWIIVGHSRIQKIAYTRMAGMVILGKTGMSQVGIGEVFDHDRTSVIHAQKKYLAFENDNSLDELTNYFVSLVDTYDYSKHDTSNARELQTRSR